MRLAITVYRRQPAYKSRSNNWLSGYGYHAFGALIFIFYISMKYHKMKKASLLILFSVLFASYTFAQTARVIGPKEKAMGDSVCSCITKLDLSKITNKTEATTAVTQCITNHLDLFMAVADERKISMDDQDGLTKIGFDIGTNLVKNGCASFIKLSALIAGKESETQTSAIHGALKSIDNKGFNYFTIVDAAKNEQSFIWLRQFPGSEKFTNGLGAYAGKSVSIKWDELEVYLPAAKGYYKVKEIVELTLE